MAKKPAPPPEEEIPPTEPPAAKGSYGRGWHEDTPDPRDWSSKGMLGAALRLSLEATGLLDHLDRVDDQSTTSSCVWHALCYAVEVRLRKMGFVPPRLSRSFGYGGARMLARSDKGMPLVDTGCYPRHAMKWARDFGMVTEADWPWSVADINKEFPWDIQQKATSFRLSGWARIDAEGHARVAEVCNALQKGFPVIFGTRVDEAFENWDGKGTVPLAGQDSLGGHMLTLLAYTTDNGEKIFRGPNSWGPYWGDRGLFWARESFITDPRAGDFYIVTVSA